jgi:hypothetical protein
MQLLGELLFGWIGHRAPEPGPPPTPAEIRRNENIVAAMAWVAVVGGGVLCWLIARG